MKKNCQLRESNPRSSFTKKLFVENCELEPQAFRCKLIGEKFESRIHARLAQSVERWTLNPTVVGSSPTLGECFSPREFHYNFYTEKSNNKMEMTL